MSKFKPEKKFMEDLLDTLKGVGIESASEIISDMLAEAMSKELISLREGLFEAMGDTGKSAELPSIHIVTTILLGAVNIVMMNGFKISKMLIESIHKGEYTAEQVIEYLNTLTDIPHDVSSRKVAKLLHDTGKLKNL